MKRLLAAALLGAALLPTSVYAGCKNADFGGIWIIYLAPSDPAAGELSCKITAKPSGVIDLSVVPRCTNVLTGDEFRILESGLRLHIDCHIDGDLNVGYLDKTTQQWVNWNMSIQAMLTANKQAGLGLYQDSRGLHGTLSGVKRPK
jgi:hypothetical protein